MSQRHTYIPQRHTHTLTHKHKPRQTDIDTHMCTHTATHRHTLTCINADIHSHTHTHNINFHQSESLPWNDRATSIFNSSLTSSKCLLAEHKHKIVTQREEKTDVDLCAGFENAFLMVTSYNYRAASRLNKPHNQDIREASQD